MTDQPPYLVELGDAQTAVVHALFDSLPRDGWVSCTVDYLSTVSMAESKVNVTDNSGASELVKSPIGRSWRSRTCVS